MLQIFPIMPGSRCLLHDFKMFIKLKIIHNVADFTCPEYFWCCLKVKFDGSSSFLSRAWFVAVSCVSIASYLLLSTQVDSSDGFYHSQPVSSMDNVGW